MFDKVFKTPCKLQHSFPECGNAKLLCLEKSVREIQPNKFQTGNYKIIFHA